LIIGIDVVVEGFVSLFIFTYFGDYEHITLGDAVGTFGSRHFLCYSYGRGISGPVI
jgi:hypothetical protein